MGQLFSFSGHVIKVLSMTILLTLLVGILSSLIVSLSLARPVKKLSDEVEEAQKNNSTSLRFSDTGIRELDQFAGAITQMNQDMLTISTKFLRIMEMASVEIGGYELRFDTGSVFYTENIFSILGIPLSAELPMNIEKFREILKEYTEKNLYKTKSGSTKLYCIRIPEKGVRYVRMEVKNENWVQIGLVEDVTVSMRERLRIEHERDYDTLTGL